MQNRWALIFAIFEIMSANYHSESLPTFRTDRVTPNSPSKRPGSFKLDKNLKMEYHLNQRSRRELLNAKGLPKKFTWRENWASHHRDVKLVHWDGNASVAIYFDYDMEPSRSWKRNYYTGRFYYDGSAKWLFEFATNVWAYVRKAYGDIGSNTYLYLVIHPHSHIYKGIHYRFSNDPENTIDNLNLIDITFPQANALLTNQTWAEEMDLLLKIIAYYVEYSSKERFGSPSAVVWNGPSYGDTAWVDIFTYDVYTSLNMTADATRTRDKYIVKGETSPKIFSFWFRDWFYPIYENYGGRSVLNEYFNLLGRFVPNFTTKDLIHVYNYNLDIGSFVHFWSGAAGKDLRSEAKLAFGWNTTYEEQFLNARIGFPGLSELYDLRDEVGDTNSIQRGRKTITTQNPERDSEPENSVTSTISSENTHVVDFESTIQISNEPFSTENPEKAYVPLDATETLTIKGLPLSLSSRTSSSLNNNCSSPQNPDYELLLNALENAYKSLDYIRNILKRRG